MPRLPTTWRYLLLDFWLVLDDDDDDFIKLSGLPDKSHTSADRMMAALGVLSIYYTFWLSLESDLRLICLGRPQLQKGDLTVDFSSAGAHDTLMSPPASDLYLTLLQCIYHILLI